MPSVIIPGTSHSIKEYAPLADEVNPPFGNVAPSPTVSNGGAVVFSQPLRSSGPNTPTDESFTSASSRVLRNFSDDLTTRIKVKSRNSSLDSFDAEADISTQNRVKGKERAWDHDGYTRPSDPQQQGSYPPLNEIEEEEKRVQANLAKFTARETARRKAARTSRIHSHSGSTSSSAQSSTTSLPRSGRPLSVLTEGLSSKRSSLRGYVGSLVGRDKNGSQELEMSGPASAPPSTNPYDAPAKPASKPVSPTSPTMQPSSPFADPTGFQSLSGAPLESPTDGGAGFGYAGAGWRGGGGPTAVPLDDEEGAVQEVTAPAKPERWWHALCAWGSDLDGGHGRKTSNQAGRTNPFE